MLRSQSDDKDFEPINTQIISSKDEGDYTFVDATAKAGRTYFYKLRDLDINGILTEHDVIRVDVAVPKVFALDQNYPNPFNPETCIRFQLPKAVHTTIRIFNIVGQEVVVLVDKVVEPGYHELTWKGLNKDDTPVGHKR